MSSAYTLTLPPNYHQPSSPSSPYLTLTVPSPREWFARFAKSSIQAFLSKAIRKGHLCIEDSTGTSEYGRIVKNGLSVRIRVHHEDFWPRIFMSGDLGFSEAYMVGDIDVDNLKGAMDLWLDNRSEMVSLSGTLGQAYSVFSGLSNALFGQTRSQARLNAMASYDQSNELFKAFLSEEMMYSCALWGPEEGGVNGDLTQGPTARDLEAAQLRKLRHVLDKARVRRGHRILEFGSGWGGLAIEAARTYGCEVDTLTLSIEQKRLAEERVRAAGLEGRVRIHLMDYRDIPAEFEHAFDAFISIEMLEHVGSQHYGQYFKLVDFALKPKNATVVVSSSTFPEGRYSAYQAEDFMRKYMWPNSCLPSATILVQSVQTSSRGRFTLESVENHAAHYPRTLRTWGRRLEQNLRQDVVASEIPALHNAAEFAMFKRKWEYLFAYAGEGFNRGYITCHMLTFTRADDPPVA
ncbi:cfs1-like protein [Phanerochaete sordida]|uniref:Cfs1-like protein n=1 Tax=Phanerochaete sordida TaxID=48140 RepID=A0A9P3FZ51_9APHY|nr:cfs1-like protein [Phanerochaete sordida]